jgi:hypothetical protein
MSRRDRAGILAAVSSFPRAFRQSLRAFCILLLLASHLAASTIAADCANRCAHTCCRVTNTGGAGAHCGLTGHAAKRACGLKARCTHSQQSAITGLPLLTSTDGPRLRLPEVAFHVAATAETSPRALARGIDSPPPQLLASTRA